MKHHLSNQQLPKEEFLNGSGKNQRLQKDKQGKVKGYILDNKTILRIPPSAQQLQVAVAGAAIHTVVQNKFLHDVKLHWTVITYSLQTITLNGKQYLTKLVLLLYGGEFQLMPDSILT